VSVGGPVARIAQLHARQSSLRSFHSGAQDLPGISISYYDTDVETIKGQTVTERDIQDWANEAERGYDVEQLRRRGRKPIGDGPASVVPVRIDSGLLAELNERAERDHVSRSEVIRAAIRSYVG
jgi:predicted transcriptional regulator